MFTYVWGCTINGVLKCLCEKPIEHHIYQKVHWNRNLARNSKFVNAFFRQTRWHLGNKTIIRHWVKKIIFFFYKPLSRVVSCERRKKDIYLKIDMMMCNKIFDHPTVFSNKGFTEFLPKLCFSILNFICAKVTLWLWII